MSVSAIPLQIARAGWGSYNQSLQKHPLLTKAITAAVGFSIGDIIAQLSTEPKRDYNLSRTLRMGAFGLLFAGPLQGHVWFNLLDKSISPRNPTKPWAVVSKMAADQLLMAPLGTACFFAWTKVTEGKANETVPFIEAKLFDTIQTGWKLWVPAHLINFAAVPSSQRVLYTNLVAIVWTYILSQAAAGGVK
ncbi:hypothetical protein WJX81_001413 [Elliptochloris bilobata]|uniref:Uncharacterized protein n=1 Tax=Elliptochloris bilobata TaxID=381761 RepID=A0AAW1RWR9_9CHLO